MWVVSHDSLLVSVWDCSPLLFEEISQSSETTTALGHTVHVGRDTMRKKATPAQIEQRKRWIARLEDPKSEQANGTLRESEGRSDAMCCLGHLCEVDLFGKWVWQDPQGTHALGCWKYVVGKSRTSEMPPLSVLKRVGIPSYKPSSEGWQDELANMNDFDGYSLAQIAGVLKTERWFGPDLDLMPDSSISLDQ